MFTEQHSKFALIMVPFLMAFSSPAMALSSAEAEAFKAEIDEAKSKMMGQSASALEHARKAHKLVLSESHEAKKARLTARWLEAEALMRLNRASDAAPVIGYAVAQAAASFEGSKLHADLLRTQAGLNARNGAHAAALPAFEKAQGFYADLGDTRSQAIVLLNIGSVYSSARDFETALGYFAKGLETSAGDPSLGLSAHNNMGNALKGLGRYDEAETAFATALALATQKGSAQLEARILTNIASAQVLGGKVAEAEETAMKAKAIGKEHAPGWVRFVDGVLAQVALANGNLVQAKAHVERVFEGENLSKTAGHFREFHQTASDCFTRLGDGPLAAAHSAALDRLNAQVTALNQ